MACVIHVLLSKLCWGPTAYLVTEQGGTLSQDRGGAGRTDPYFLRVPGIPASSAGRGPLSWRRAEGGRWRSAGDRQGEVKLAPGAGRVGQAHRAAHGGRRPLAEGQAQ